MLRTQLSIFDANAPAEQIPQVRQVGDDPAFLLLRLDLARQQTRTDAALDARDQASAPAFGITHGLDFPIPDNWSADQALAVVELIDDLRERITAHYQIPLNDLLHGQRPPPDNPHPRDIDDPF
ncbi:hypothetical protein [Paraburkholderia sp. RL17-373-BIF-A]|uniref:hypothetical protein n=1 Tax=Paraburkholderia sp. RL17-373-BIF-A TaxID=3031629 RepID=UPI0038BE04DC